MTDLSERLRGFIRAYEEELSDDPYGRGLIEEAITALEAAEQRIEELEKHRLKECPLCNTKLHRIFEVGPAYCPDENCAWSEWVDSHESFGYVERLELKVEELTNENKRIEELEYKLGEAVKIAEREVDYRKRLDVALNEIDVALNEIKKHFG